MIDMQIKRILVSKFYNLKFLSYTSLCSNNKQQNYNFSTANKSLIFLYKLIKAEIFKYVLC